MNYVIDGFSLRVLHAYYYDVALRNNNQIPKKITHPREHFMLKKILDFQMVFCLKR